MKIHNFSGYTTRMPLFSRISLLKVRIGCTNRTYISHLLSVVPHTQWSFGEIAEIYLSTENSKTTLRLGGVAL